MIDWNVYCEVSSVSDSPVMMVKNLMWTRKGHMIIKSYSFIRRLYDYWFK
jgi:hypothetical protein